MAKQMKIVGTERTDIIPDLEKAAKKYMNVRDERMELTVKEGEAQAALVAMMITHKKTEYLCDFDNKRVTMTEAKVKAKVRDLESPSADEDDTQN